MPLLAITLHQPWAFIVMHQGKNIENRDWEPPAALRGQHPYIAIHAGKFYSEPGAQWLRERGCVWRPEDILLGAVLGTAKIVDVVTKSDSKWFMGIYGWILDEITPLEKPIPCRGFQKVWGLPPAVEDAMKRQMGDKFPLRPKLVESLPMEVTQSKNQLQLFHDR